MKLTAVSTFVACCYFQFCHLLLSRFIFIFMHMIHFPSVVLCPLFACHNAIWCMHELCGLALEVMGSTLVGMGGGGKGVTKDFMFRRRSH
ncbi:hypothetical protein, unlikely [Trypanosoma brucei gambiense DAL972]|uniref:Uncharacterized protein n=2 Tax=Trypanosoma brucei TaxID=5691 RepID=C9ZI16_TRYB9|nr:hypothetical protein, unlikely [Trypanosoma brucei gambiense DAL972]RHW74491.1 hypothetical protein DPX39_010043500 [Trypanosoma brucei equiperdum]CBH09133.1 hypothetical protein, unlikely [Trypanosoma brucei gambiense DAL972]|eukprot:XP_011771574.1 hypothetical protein, unlikely [Trypanosoma brucei gambiense DAL972]